MYYLIYKTTCLINGKYYIGKHKTSNRDDSYIGSGKLLQTAIKKYGRENFIREIILECSSEEEMNIAEKILVVPDKKTMVLISASEIGESLYKSEQAKGIINPSIELLQEWIKNELAEIKNKSKRNEKTGL